MHPSHPEQSHLDKSTEILWGTTDTNFRCIHTNRLFQQHFGLENEEWKGRHFAEIVGALQMEKLLRVNEECLHHPEKTIAVEIQTTAADQVHWFKWEISALVNQHGVTEGIRFSGTDITRQKEAANVLRQHAILLDNISDAVISTDSCLRISNWNLQAQKTFFLPSLQAQPILLSSLWKIESCPDGEGELQLQRQLTRHGCWSGAVSLQQKTGAIMYLHTHINAIADAAGKVTGYVAVCRDVTREHAVQKNATREQEQTQLDLFKQRQQFSAFMENAPTLAWINDEEGLLQYVNTRFQTHFKLGETAIGKNRYLLYPESRRADHMAGDRDVLDRGQPAESFEETLGEDGSKIFHHVYRFPLGTVGGKRLMGGLALNITNQVKGRQEIIKARSQFESFMENAPLLAWITDRDGRLQFMNSRFRQAYGYTDAHLYQKLGTITPLSEEQRSLSPNACVLEQHQNADFFDQLTEPNGEVHYYKTYKFPVRDADGNIMEGGQSMEITSELLAQQELKRSNELFEYAGKATRDVIWDWDLREDKIRRTESYTSLFGYEKSELHESNAYRKVHRDDIGKVLRIVQQSFDSNQSRWQMEYRYLCADGSFKMVIDQAYIIRDGDGNAIRVIGSMQDVTEERHLQAQVLLTEKQKQKDVINAVISAQEKERNELSAELHDNVNQLLAAAILYLKTAQKQDVIKEAFITQSLDYVQKAVEELRNISRNLTPSEIKINGLLAALKVFAEKLHIPKNFEVTLDVRDVHEEKINPTLKFGVYRILQELINNILKHACASQVTIRLMESAGDLILIVTDNGKGFETATVKMGLGITNINNRVETLGGTAAISSSAGNGCTWKIGIPMF